MNAMLLESEVHSYLRDFWRAKSQPHWQHHLTMARLVARALRLGRSALIQTGSSVKRYCYSYITPALLGNSPVLIVAPLSVQKQLQEVAIPQLQQWLATNKSIIKESALVFPSSSFWENFDGIMLIEPQTWLRARLNNQGGFPGHIPTLIDGADNLEAWATEVLTLKIQEQDWEQLKQQAPKYRELITDTQIKLTKTIFSHPQNPYEAYLIDVKEKQSLENLCQTLALESLLTEKMAKFWQQLQLGSCLIWASRCRDTGKFTINLAPGSVAGHLQPIWSQQPIVLMGSFLDSDQKAQIYRRQVGLEDDILTLKFSPHRQTEELQIYSPDGLPLPNTPEFQPLLLEQIRSLVSLSSNVNKPIVLVIDDLPLKAQIGTAIAAEFGSRVEVEKTNLIDNSILVTGWQFWREHQHILLIPQLLVIATLPIPSLENPLVASRVAYYKNQRQDWFRKYLLPTALKEIQTAVLSLRESQGIVAILDNRVNHRSYGNKILSALEPCAKINYLDSTWFC